MADVLKPGSPDEVAALIAAARTPLEIRGLGTKWALGRPAPDGLAVLDLSRLAGITLYEPEELILSARAATPLKTIRAALAEKRQELAFDPPDLSGLLGANGEGSIGGAVACNLSGPRRIKAGAARDHFLGFSGVNGRGEAFKSGGRVVKNVTGFDLSKLMAGSFGTLAAMTDITVKVMPKAEKIRTVLIFGLSPEAATAAMRDAMGSAHEVAAAAYWPADAAKTSAVEMVARAGASVAALRVEGPGPSADYRCRALRGVVAGETEELHSQNSETFWREARDVMPFRADKAAQIWRISVAPSDGARIAGAIAARLGGRYVLDWAGGLVWLALDPLPDAGVETVRGLIAPHGGHATLLRAAADIRARVPVFQPDPEPLVELTRRIKDGFDPAHRLNPGRMVAGD